MQGKSIVASDKVDGGILAMADCGIQIARASDPFSRRCSQTAITFQKTAKVITKLAIPFRPVAP